MDKRIFRQHPLSHVPGGCVVKVVHVDGGVREHDWVKYPERYINEMLDCNDLLEKHGVATGKNTVAEVYIDGELVWDINDQDPTIKHQEYEHEESDDHEKRSSSWDMLKNVQKYAKKK